MLSVRKDLRKDVCISPFAASGVVTARGSPPDAGMRWRPDIGLGVKTIVPSAPQLPPRGIRSVAESDRRAAGERHLLQLSFGEEADLRGRPGR